MVNAAVAGPSAKPSTGSADPAEPGAPVEGPSCTVFGQPVTELRTLLTGPGYSLITKDGSFTFTRVYFCPGPVGSQYAGKPGFDLGDGHSRAVAGQKLLKANLDHTGLWLTFTDYSALVPLGQLSPTWKTA